MKSLFEMGLIVPSDRSNDYAGEQPGRGGERALRSAHCCVGPLQRTFFPFKGRLTFALGCFLAF